VSSFFRAIYFVLNIPLVLHSSRRVPIWKKEIYEGDESVWKENVEWHEGRRRRVMVKDNNTIS